ncbi:hypothetical protein BKA70DRAFT_1304566 [Coprinopsis sp. MPI-PUGE-AT-0042]|nr:hypothetical protein BKA70DRAFT_1304566 [Coprinopsis sp. MPI-PUGE-AT-0042]
MKLSFVSFLIHLTSTPRSGALQTDTPRCRPHRPTATVSLPNSCKTLSHKTALSQALMKSVNSPCTTKTAQILTAMGRTTMLRSGAKGMPVRASDFWLTLYHISTSIDW